MPSSSPQKRKASEISDDQETGLSSSKRKTGKGRKKHASYAQQAQLDDGPPFRCVCPYNSTNGAYQNASVEHAVLSEGFEWDVAVIPTMADGRQWTNIKKYRNVKLTETTFTEGEIIYISRSSNPPAPPTDLTEEQLLLFDRANYWVGKIVQCRASSDKEVFLLVAWLYWPEELPFVEKGRKDPRLAAYANGELVLSNAFEVVDATTISSKADIPYWDESNDALMSNVPDRFWRAKYDTSKGLSASAVTPLRKFCICNRPYNPDRNMYHCSNRSCGIWLHEECLADDIGDKIWHMYTTGKMDEYATAHPPVTTKSIADHIMGPVKAIGHAIEDRFDTHGDHGTEHTQAETETTLNSVQSNGTRPTNGTSKSPVVTKPRGRPKKATWQTKLDIRIIAEEDKPLIATIAEKSPSSAAAKTWQVKVDCLKCHKTMD